MKIIYDLDDSLLDFKNPFLRFINATYNKNIRPKDLTEFDLPKMIGMSKEMALEALAAFWKSDYVHEMKPIKDAPYCVEESERHGALGIVVSARAHICEEITRRQVDTYFPSLNGNIYLTNHMTKEGARCSKAEIGKKIRGDVAIDDGPPHAEKYLKTGIDVIMPRQRWNENFYPSGTEGRLYKPKSMLDIPDYVYNIGKKLEKIECTPNGSFHFI